MEIKKFEFLKLGADASQNAALAASTALNQVEDKESRTFRFFAGSLLEVEDKEFTKTELDKAREQAHQAGLNEGYKKAEAEITEKTLVVEQQNSQAISGVAETLGNIDIKIEEEKRQFKQDIITLARDALNAVCGNVFEEKASEVFASAIDEAYPIYERKGKIVIKASANIIEQLQEKLTKQFAEKELKAEVSFEAEDGNINMCRLEWENSGINIDLNEKLKQVENIFDEYLKSLK